MGAHRSRLPRHGLVLALLAIGLGVGPPAAGQEARSLSANTPAKVDFKGEPAASDVRAVAQWAITSGDSRASTFVIIDKRNARVFVFDSHGSLAGSSPVLLGLGVGDDSAPGIGRRRLATIRPEERTTPAGRFRASLGHDLEQDVLWVDYESSLSLHRVIVGNPKDQRRRRLASTTHLDNRISYGCINVPAAFYDKVVIPAFAGRVGFVYILPESRPLGDVFAMGGGAAVLAVKR